MLHLLASSTVVLWQGSPDYYELTRQGRTYIDIWKTELNPALNGGHDVTQWAGDRYFTARGLRSIVHYPVTLSTHRVGTRLCPSRWPR